MTHHFQELIVDVPFPAKNSSPNTRDAAFDDRKQPISHCAGSSHTCVQSQGGWKKSISQCILDDSLGLWNKLLECNLHNGSPGCSGSSICHISISSYRSWEALTLSFYTTRTSSICGARSRFHCTRSLACLITCINPFLGELQQPLDFIEHELPILRCPLPGV